MKNLPLLIGLAAIAFYFMQRNSRYGTLASTANTPGQSSPGSVIPLAANDPNAGSGFGYDIFTGMYVKLNDVDQYGHGLSTGPIPDTRYGVGAPHAADYSPLPMSDINTGPHALNWKVL